MIKMTFYYQLKFKNKSIAQLQKDKEFAEYEKLISELYTKGYREMPLDMKNIIINKLQKDSSGLILTDHTPKGFQTINPKDDRYATLSWGMFDEVHEPKLIEQYGRALLNIKTKKITKFVVADTLYNKYQIDAAVFAWQVDPLAAISPNNSPYLAFADNPIVFIDPDGNTEFFFNGKWIGNDGVDNNIIAVVESRKLKRQINSATKNGQNYTKLGNIENGTKSDTKGKKFWAINKDVLQKANEVLDWSLDKGKDRERTVTMNQDNNDLSKYNTNEDLIGPKINWDMPYNNGPGVNPSEISFHNHPTGAIINRSGNAASFSADNPSDNGHDDKFFTNFKMNIIVGLNGYARTGYSPPDRSGNSKPVVIDDRLRDGSINIWGNSTTSKIGSLSGNEANKILNYFKKK